MEAELLYCPDAFEPGEARRLFESLRRGLDWEQHYIRMMGREVPCPRLSAWVGDRGARYTYSGLELDPARWTDSLMEIRDRVASIAGFESNSVLANLYRDGEDSMGWHSDDEPELGPDPVIASVSFGARRRFVLKHRTRRDVDRIDLELADGSLLLMSGSTQRYWKHRVPKTRRPVGERINLTLRRIVVGIEAG